MVARGGEGVRQLAKNILAVVMDLTRFTVEKFRSANDLAAESGADGLMAEAHTEDGKFTGKPLDEFHADSSFQRRAKTERNYDAFRLSAGNIIDGCLHI